MDKEVRKNEKKQLLLQSFKRERERERGGEKYN